MKNKIKEMILKVLLKKGLFCESEDFDMELEVPLSMVNETFKGSLDKITIRIKAENVTIKIEK